MFIRALLISKQGGVGKKGSKERERKRETQVPEAWMFCWYALQSPAAPTMPHLSVLKACSSGEEQKQIVWNRLASTVKAACFVGKNHKVQTRSETEVMTEGKAGGTEHTTICHMWGIFSNPLPCILYRHSKKTPNVPLISLFPDTICRYDLLFWSIHWRLVCERKMQQDEIAKK